MNSTCPSCLGARTTVGNHLGSGLEYSDWCETCGGSGEQPTCVSCGSDLLDEEIRSGLCCDCEAADVCCRCLARGVVAVVNDEQLCERCLADSRGKAVA